MYYIIQDKDLKGNSVRWANWMSQLTITTCQPCAEKHGTIVPISILKELPMTVIKKHPRRKCIYVPMRTKTIGTATDKGFNGADAFLYYIHKLPDYYINKDTAMMLGWKSKQGNLADIFPGKMIGGDIYLNDDGKLPNAAGRVWYEADINYTGRYRNGERIVYSTDGLIFVTYDHYRTFYEIKK